MRKLTAIAALLLFACATEAQQTTTVNFDTPACSESGNVGTYGGISFFGSPWDCENPNLAGQTGESLSWNQNIKSGKFSFLTPSVLQSFSAATSSGSGTLTITTDQGESFAAAITGTWQNFSTRFAKPATVVTVAFPGGWTIELDNLVYGPTAAVPQTIPVIISFPGSGAGAGFTITVDAASIPTCVQSVDGDCSLTLQLCDTKGNCIFGAGSLSIQKSAGGATVTTILANVTSP